jgi:2-hydroxychromene-2-carboxylate isomerase
MPTSARPVNQFQTNKAESNGIGRSQAPFDGPTAGRQFDEQVRQGGPRSIDALAAVAEEVGLSGDELRSAVGSQAVKDQLETATAHAWELGVRGLPTVRVGQRLFYGDDQLELAASTLRS